MTKPMDGKVIDKENGWTDHVQDAMRHNCVFWHRGQTIVPAYEHFCNKLHLWVRASSREPCPSDSLGLQRQQYRPN